MTATVHTLPNRSARRKAGKSVDTVPSADAVLDAYPSTYLTCRADRHQWQREHVWRLIAPTIAELRSKAYRLDFERATRKREVES